MTMRRWSGLRAAALPVAGLLLAAACGSSGGGTKAGPSAGSAGGCTPAKSDALVTLADDKLLQNSDNVVPVVTTTVAKPPLTDALNAVSAVLSQEALNALNTATDVDRMQPAQVAQQFVADNKLGEGLSGGSGSIVVVAANFSENQTLANIFADVLTKAGYSASVKPLTNRELYEPALESGQVQVVPEYAATLTEFLNQKQNGKSAAALAKPDINATIAALTPLASKAGLTVLKPAAATDQNAFAVTKAFADQNGLKTLSDLAAKCNGGTLRLGGPAECPKRPFCQAGLESTYGLKFTAFTALDTGGPLDKNALKQGKVDVALVFSSDAAVTPAQ